MEKQVGSKGLDSTEIYKNKVWKTVAGKLNDAQFWGPKATNINNKVLLFGKYKKKSKFGNLSYK